MPRTDRELRIALTLVALLALPIGGGIWWLLNQAEPPQPFETKLRDLPEVERSLAKQSLEAGQPAKDGHTPKQAQRTLPGKVVGPRGLPTMAGVDTLAEARRLPDKSLNLGYTALLIARQSNPGLLTQRYLDRLDEMARKILRSLPAKTSPRETARAISTFLFEQEKFTYHAGGLDGVHPHNAYLDSVLDSKQGYCLTLSLLYLVLGERLGLPLRIVELPDHVFVRYEAQGAYFNIETTAGGKMLSDAEYRKRHPFPKQAEGSYLKSRKPRTAIAFLLLSHGLILWADDKVEAARAAFIEGLRWDPGNFYLTYNLANAELKREQWEEARDLYRKFLEYHPDKSIGWLGLARAHIGLLDLAAADRALGEGIEHDPENTEIRLVQAELAYRRKQYVRVHTLLEHTPGKEFEANFLRARAYMEVGQNGKAIPLLRQLVEQRPDMVLFKRKLGHCLARVGKIGEARTVLEGVLAVEPKDIYALATLGMFAYQQKRFQDAVALFERALTQNGDTEVIYNNLATCLIKTDQAPRAARIAVRGLRRFPRSLRLARLAGVTYLNHLKDPVKARRYLEHYQRLGGKDQEILRWLAREK